MVIHWITSKRNAQPRRELVCVVVVTPCIVRIGYSDDYKMINGIGDTVTPSLKSPTKGFNKMRLYFYNIDLKRVYDIVSFVRSNMELKIKHTEQNFTAAISLLFSQSKRQLREIHLTFRKTQLV